MSVWKTAVCKNVSQEITMAILIHTISHIAVLVPSLNITLSWWLRTVLLRTPELGLVVHRVYSNLAFGKLVLARHHQIQIQATFKVFMRRRHLFRCVCIIQVVFEKRNDVTASPVTPRSMIARRCFLLIPSHLLSIFTICRLSTCRSYSALPHWVV